MEIALVCSLERPKVNGHCLGRALVGTMSRRVECEKKGRVGSQAIDCPGIIDIGASKTVISQGKIQALVCKYWGNFSRWNSGRNPAIAAKIQAGRKIEKGHLQLCTELFCHQVSLGRPFHLEQPQGCEALNQGKLKDVVSGTFRTVFDMCEGRANGPSAHAKSGHLRTPKASQLRTPKAVICARQSL